jgi:hypothetical protein
VDRISRNKYAEVSITRLNECYWLDYQTWTPVVRPGHIVDPDFHGVYLDGLSFSPHRVVWALYYNEWPPRDLMIDHIDGNHGNNAIYNLRLATHKQNMANKVSRGSGGGLPGVLSYKKTRRHVAKFIHEGREFFVGEFDCPAAAFFHFQVAHCRLYGEFSGWHFWRIPLVDAWMASLVEAGRPSAQEVEDDVVSRYGLEYLGCSSRVYLADPELVRELGAELRLRIHAADLFETDPIFRRGISPFLKST